MVQDGELHFEAELVRRQLDRVLSSHVFSAAKRSRMYLRYIVERTLLGSPPKEFEIAVEILGRGTDYDPDKDAAVRVEASRLRSRLREYYDTVGKDDPVYINIPKGAYRAVFSSPVGSQPVSAAVTEKSAALPDVTASDSASGFQALGSAAPQSNAAESQPRTAHAWSSAGLLSLRDYPIRWFGAVLGVAVVIGIAVLVTPRVANFKQQDVAPIRSLAVLPLQNTSGDVREEYFADGITDALITELAHTPHLRVVSRTSVMQEKGSKKPLRQIASALNVDAVIEGSLMRSGDHVRITAQLIDARDDRHLWAQSYEEQMSDILILQDRVVQEIALQTEAVLIPPRGSVRARRINPAAYDAYLRGLYLLHQRSVNNSITYFEQAAALDSTYAPVYAGLAEALTTRSVGGAPQPEDQSQALAAAKRAIELDADSGQAYAALGLVEMYYAKDWTAAGRDLEKGIALSPSDSLAEMHYSIYLDAMARPEEAVTHMRRALQLDPRSFLMNRHLGSTLYLARHYQEALHYLQWAEEMQPTAFGYVEEWITRVYEMTHRTDDAVRADLRQWSAIVPDGKLEPLRKSYRLGGWKAYQRARIDLIDQEPRNACDLYEIGESYVRFGDRDRAFSWLARGVEAKCFWADLLPVDPILDDIRSDPRFSALLQMARSGRVLKAAAN